METGKACAGCGKTRCELTVLGRFCSWSCEAVWRWRRRMGYTNPD